MKEVQRKFTKLPCLFSQELKNSLSIMVTQKCLIAPVWSAHVHLTRWSQPVKREAQPGPVWQHIQATHRSSGTQNWWELLRSDSGSPGNTSLKITSEEGARSSEQLMSLAFVSGFLYCLLNSVDLFGGNDISHWLY